MSGEKQWSPIGLNKCRVLFLEKPLRGNGQYFICSKSLSPVKSNYCLILLLPLRVDESLSLEEIIR